MDDRSDDNAYPHPRTGRDTRRFTAAPHPVRVAGAAGFTPTAAHRGESCPATRWAELPDDTRRASRFLIAENAIMAGMERKPGRPSKGPRTAVIFRVPTPTRLLAQQRLEHLGRTLNDHMQTLVTADVAQADLAAGPASAAPTSVRFGAVALQQLRPAAACVPGRIGRPSKGPRTTVVLRVPGHLADHIHRRADQLGSSVTDYLESLLARDVGGSAHHPDTKEAHLHRTA